MNEVTMTTTITIETHNWPVEAVIDDDLSHSDPTGAFHQYGHQSRREFIPKGEKRTYHVTSTRRIAFTELRAEATSLNDAHPIADPVMSNSAIGGPNDF